MLVHIDVSLKYTEHNTMHRWNRGVREGTPHSDTKGTSTVKALHVKITICSVMCYHNVVLYLL